MGQHLKTRPMLKNVFFPVLAAIMGHKRAAMLFITLVAFGATSTAQTDSTDLELYMTDVVLESALDSMLYGGDLHDQLNLDFTVSDTVAFSKVHILLKETELSKVIFKKTYTLSNLEAQSLIASWDVSIPFGNLENALSYTVAIIVESYDGSLGATITKTLNP